MLVKKKRTLNFHQGSFYSCLVRLVSCPLCIICANTSSYFIHILNNRTCSELASVIAERANLFAEVKRLRSTICCKQQCYAFARWIAQSLAMSAALDFRKCKRLLLSSLAVSCTACRGANKRSAVCRQNVVLFQVRCRMKKDNPIGLSFLVRSTGLEPAWSYHKILSLARLPIPPWPLTALLVYKILRILSMNLMLIFKQK